jgi:glycosyltransferase involved in cell wall biosynthesis
MKITILGTYDRLWGASIATMRTAEALLSVGANVKFLVLQAVTPKPYMDIVEQNAFDHRYSQWLLLREKAYLYFHDNPATRNDKKYFNFSFSLANTGRSIVKRKSIREADIIHLNWINNAFLSLRSVEELLRLNKPLVWTLHDQWAFTGGCHIGGYPTTMNCDHYVRQCGNCPYLRKKHADDLSHRQWLTKKALYDSGKFHFTAPSTWMQQSARSAGLLQNHTVSHVPHPIDTRLFKPQDQAQARQALALPPDKKLILFGSASLTNQNKGFPHLYKALQILRQERQDIEVVIYGFAHTKPTLPDMPLHYLGMIKSDAELARCYAACDLLVIPSSVESFSLVTQEAHSCGRPVVAFGVGGLTDLVEDGFNGYLVPYGDVAGLADGIRKVFSAPDHYQRLCENARNRSVERFDYEVIGKRYLAFYESLLL